MHETPCGDIAGPPASERSTRLRARAPSRRCRTAWAAAPSRRRSSTRRRPIAAPRSRARPIRGQRARRWGHRAIRMRHRAVRAPASARADLLHQGSRAVPRRFVPSSAPCDRPARHKYRGHPRPGSPRPRALRLVSSRWRRVLTQPDAAIVASVSLGHGSGSNPRQPSTTLRTMTRRTKERTSRLAGGRETGASRRVLVAVQRPHLHERDWTPLTGGHARHSCW